MQQGLGVNCVSTDAAVEQANDSSCDYRYRLEPYPIHQARLASTYTTALSVVWAASSARVLMHIAWRVMLFQPALLYFCIFVVIVVRIDALPGGT